jgi:hypothetical protein
VRVNFRMPHRQSREIPAIRVVTETESDHGWLFVVAIPAVSGETVEHEMTMAWVDYEYWSHGMHSPSRVAEAVARAMVEHDPERDWPRRFDASTARRWVKGLDERVREGL